MGAAGGGAAGALTGAAVGYKAAEKVGDIAQRAEDAVRKQFK